MSPPPLHRERPRDFATRGALIARQRRRGAGRARWRRVMRRTLRLTAAGAALAALGVTAQVGVHWITTTPALAVTRLDVIGARRLPEEAIRRAAEFTPGTNLVTLDPAPLAERVEALPGIRRARVIRQLPNRVTLLVEEREPYALLNAGTVSPRRSPLQWIDADGYLVGPEDRPAAPVQPILSGARPVTPDGDPVEMERLRAGLALLRALQRVGPRVMARVSEIDVTAPDDPVLYLVDGATVRVGAERWEEHLGRLDGVLTELSARGERVASVDLRFRDLVVYVPRAPAVRDDRESTTTGTPGSVPVQADKTGSHP